MSDQVKYGAGPNGQFYHRLRPRRGSFGVTLWFDCNSWAREPMDEPPAGKRPCPKCVKEVSR